MKNTRKIIVFFVFCFMNSLLLTLQNFACDSLQEEYLDWKNRPQQIKNHIRDKHIGNTSTFSDFFQDKKIVSDEPIFCQMNPLYVIQNILMEAQETQKTFFFLNLDVEDFKTNWMRSALATFKSNQNLLTDIRVYFIATCSHVCSSKTDYREGIFHLYEFDQFPAEYVRDALYKESLFLENEIDAVFTHKSLFKQSDPVGTCLQIYNLLRPKTGLFFGDEFYFNIEGNALKDGTEIFAYHMSLFRDIGAPFMIKRSFPEGARLNFVIRRNDKEPCHIPMQYLALERISPNPNLTSGAVTVFKYTLKWDNHPLSDDSLARTFYHGLERRYWIFGDKALYTWFKDRNLFIPNQSSPLKFWDPNGNL